MESMSGLPSITYGDWGMLGRLRCIDVEGSMPIEKSRKNARDHAKLLYWLERVRDELANAHGSRLPGSDLSWAGVVLICTLAFQRKLVQDLKNSGRKQGEIDQLR